MAKNSLNVINSVALHDINFPFNVQSNLSNKSDYLIMAFSKAKKHIDDKIEGNKTYLITYKIKDKSIRTIQIPDYVVLSFADILFFRGSFDGCGGGDFHFFLCSLFHSRHFPDWK